MDSIMKKLFMYEVYVSVPVESGSEMFGLTYLVDEADIDFVSLDKNISVSSWTTQEVAEEDAKHLIKYIPVNSEVDKGRIEINGYPLDAEQD